MKAWVLEEPAPLGENPLRFMEVPAPEPGPGELLVRVNTCAVCRTDLHVVEGDLPVRRRPLIPGHQIVGRVERSGGEVRGFASGQRVGAAWLHRTCGACRFCRSGRENLCERAEFTGWSVDGGYAEFATVPAAFAYPVPDGFSDLQAAPLLCAGIIGFRSLKLTGLGETARPWKGARLGIFGFGAAGHVVIQLARARGAEVFVFTRDRERHRKLAAELGAAWVGGAGEAPPPPLDAAIVFAPAGELIPPALATLDRGGVLVLGGIHMSPIPEFPYRLLYGERTIRSVANNLRADGREFLEEAARIPVQTRVEAFPLARADEALRRLKHDAVRGAAVLVVNPDSGPASSAATSPGTSR